MKFISLALPVGLGLVVVLFRRRVSERPSHVRKVLSNGFVTEGASLGDINGDGTADLVAGPYWYAGPDFEKQNRYRPGRAGRSEGLCP